MPRQVVLIALAEPMTSRTTWGWSYRAVIKNFRTPNLADVGHDATGHDRQDIHGPTGIDAGHGKHRTATFHAGRHGTGSTAASRPHGGYSSG